MQQDQVGAAAADDFLIRPVVAEHRLLAQQGALAGGQVQVVDAYRQHERGCADAQLRRRPVGVARQAGRHQLRLESDLLGRAVGAVGSDGPQLDSGQRLPAVADHEVLLERVDPVQADVVAAFDEGAERRRVADRRVDEGEVDRAVVVHDEEAVLTADDGVLHRVLDEVAARQHHGELSFRVGRVGVAHLGGDRTARRDEHVLVAAGAPDRQPEAFVGFVVHLLGGQSRCQPVPPHRVRPPRVVDRHVVDGAVVRRPGDPGADSGDHVLVQVAGA